MGYIASLGIGLLVSVLVQLLLSKNKAPTRAEKARTLVIGTTLGFLIYWVMYFYA